MWIEKGVWDGVYVERVCTGEQMAGIMETRAGKGCTGQGDLSQ